MNQFSFGERYRLEIHWSKVIYESEGVAKFLNCELKGPATSELIKLNEKDFIRLDFVNQYITLLPEYYVVIFSWEGVEYKERKIFLKNTTFTNKNITVLPKLRSNDYIVIDTSNHENEKHNYNINYKAYLIKSDGEKYNFKG